MSIIKSKVQRQIEKEEKLRKDSISSVDLVPTSKRAVKRMQKKKFKLPFLVRLYIGKNIVSNITVDRKLNKCQETYNRWQKKMSELSTYERIFYGEDRLEAARKKLEKVQKRKDRLAQIGPHAKNIFGAFSQMARTDMIANATGIVSGSTKGVGRDAVVQSGRQYDVESDASVASFN